MWFIAVVVRHSSSKQQQQREARGKGKGWQINRRRFRRDYWVGLGSLVLQERLLGSLVLQGRLLSVLASARRRCFCGGYANHDRNARPWYLFSASAAINGGFSPTAALLL